ncbi:MAG: amidohydrolase/deacetylase family metallohydrolase [Acidobacteriota bacterium]
MMRRRQFLCSAAVYPALIASRGNLFAAEYDLVIRGGRVLDPSQGIDRTADVAIRAGKIAAIRRDIPTSSAAQTIDAQGRLVVPGLIDVHLHARDAALPPPEILSTGVTTMVDGGSRGADNVEQLIEVARNSPNRMRILLNIARLGNNNPDGRGEFLDSIEPAQVEKALGAVARNREWIIGIKARLSRGAAADRDMEVLRRAVQVAGPLNIPIMVHIGDTASPLPQLLALLRPGDIVTHLYAPTPHGIMDERGMVLPEVRQARRRGILFDFGNGLNEHWTWEVAQSGLKQNFPPDTISTDLSVPGRRAQVFDLPNVLSKFLAMGMPLNQVIACATKNAARTFKELKPYGSLRSGATADVTILELAQGNFEFVDNYGTKKTNSQKLITRGVIVGGKRIV